MDSRKKMKDIEADRVLSHSLSPIGRVRVENESLRRKLQITMRTGDGGVHETRCR